MGKRYKKYKNFLEKFLDSNQGKRFFNIAYSVGAAIVIIGAMGKLLHWRAGDALLMIGMITEAIVFLISAFEKPEKEYNWEEVYPVLADNEDFIPKAQREVVSAQAQVQSVVGGPAVQSTAVPSSQGAKGNAATGQQASQSSGGSAGTVILGGGSSGSGSGIDGSAVSGTSGSGGLSGNITIVSGGSAGMGGSGNASAAPEEIAALSENVEQFSHISDSLNKISETLSKSFQTILENSEGIGHNTQGYITQMEALNRNLSGLNTIYEVQLKGISGQIGTIEHINAGLERIKKLYDGSLADSSIFKTETEKMAQQLAELNRVYARLLEAMTTNMNMGGFGTSNPNKDNNQP